MPRGIAKNCQKYFDDLPISISKLSEHSGLDEASLRRIREGEKPIQQTTFNKWVVAMGKLEDPVTIPKNGHWEPVSDPNKARRKR